MNSCSICNGRGWHSQVARHDDPDAHTFVGSFGLQFRYKNVRCAHCAGSGESDDPSRWDPEETEIPVEGETA